MSAILFGSVSTVIDTSELQRSAFNQAFADHGLDWHWDRADYASLLAQSGGRDRITTFAKERGEEVDAAAIHATKSALFQKALASAGLPARPGVVDTIRQAKEAGLKVGFVTSTSAENVSALLSALASELGTDEFDVVTDTSSVDAVKPDPAAYLHALSELGVDAGDCIAVEDNLDGVSAAQAAGIVTVAFPNGNTSGHDFSSARASVDHVDLKNLQSLLTTD